MLGGRFGYFLVFSSRGGGRGSLRRREGGGVQLFIENPRSGALQEGRGRGAGVSAANWGIGGGGAKIIFFGAEMSTKIGD